MTPRLSRPLAFSLAAILAAGPLAVSAQAPESESSSGDQTPEHEARLTGVTGTVYVHLRDQEEDQFVPAEADASLDEGDVIRTGDDGTAELSLDGQSVIEIAPNSDFVINSLADEKTEFHVGIGSIVAKIKHLLKGQDMAFATPTAVASVRGTELGVWQEPGDAQSHVGVFDEGQVSVTRPGSREQAKLGPGQELEVNQGKPLGRPGALARFAAARQRLGALRQRQAQLAQGWARRNAAARQAARAKLRARQALRANQLQHVRADMANRRYQALKARQQELRQRHEQQLKQRAERQRQAQERRQAQQRKAQRQSAAQEARRKANEARREEAQRRRQKQQRQQQQQRKNARRSRR